MKFTIESSLAPRKLGDLHCEAECWLLLTSTLSV